MILVQASVAGRMTCGSLHIRNLDASHPEHPAKGYYEVMCYDEKGDPIWHVSKVEHTRSDPWYVLLQKCLEARP